MGWDEIAVSGKVGRKGGGRKREEEKNLINGVEWIGCWMWKK